LLLAVGALPGCSDQNSTGPEEYAVQPTQHEALTADPAADESVAALALTRSPKSFFVNPSSGLDTNPGTKLKPFKTLARGLSTAIAGDTMRLASGTYSAGTGERFTTGSQQVLVPAGVVILGTPAGDFPSHQFGSHLHGSGGEIGLDFNGAATVRNVILSGFNTGIRATQGVQSLKSLKLRENLVGLEVAGSAKATLVGSTVTLTPAVGFVGVLVRQQAQLIVDGGAVTSPSPNCLVTMTAASLKDAARLTLKNGATLKDIAGTALQMRGTSKATLTSFASIKRNLISLPGCHPLPSVLTLDATSLTLRNADVVNNGGTGSIGIDSRSSALLTLDSAALEGHSGVGLRAQGAFKLVASRATIRQNNIGIDAHLAPDASITVTASTVSFNHAGIRAPFFKLRNSVVSSNDIGIVLTSPFTDLGQTFDPGNNRIAGNTVTGVNFDASIINGRVGGVFASGNTWNARTQDSDSSGHYPLKPLLDELSPFATGKNFVLPQEGDFQIQL
jgi:hypothetical protein